MKKRVAVGQIRVSLDLVVYAVVAVQQETSKILVVGVDRVGCRWAFGDNAFPGWEDICELDPVVGEWIAW